MVSIVKRHHDTLSRQWQLLRLLPRHPQKITAGDLQRQLERDGFETTKRTIERDLNFLSESFPILLDDRDKPYGWSWKKDAPTLSVPGLTVPQALAFALVKRFLGPLLPASLVAELDAHFTAAEKQLAALPKSRGVPSWIEKVRAVPPAQPLLPPKINQKVQATVYEALLQSKQIQIAYHKRGATSQVEYTVHPLAIVQRGPVTYLVCTLFKYQDVLLLALHRILSAVLLEDKSKYPDGFRLDDYLASGALNFGKGERIRLEAIFSSEAAEHLHETPLSEDQQIKPLDAGRVTVSATVLDTPQLAWWLLAFGEGVEVVKPAALRAEMARTAEALARLYRS